MTEGIDYGLLDIPSERAKLVDWLAGKLTEWAGLHRYVAPRAAEAAVSIFQVDLGDADSYRWLRGEIMKTMADPDGWDFDEAEPSALMRYIEHMSKASHGECGSCDNRIAAGEHYEAVDNLGNSVPEGTPGCLAYCQDCV